MFEYDPHDLSIFFQLVHRRLMRASTKNNSYILRTIKPKHSEHIFKFSVCNVANTLLIAHRLAMHIQLCEFDTGKKRSVLGLFWYFRNL